VSVVSRTSGAWLDSHGSAQWISVAALSVAWASLSWHLFERPLNELKRHFPYVRDGSANPDRAAFPLEHLLLAEIQVRGSGKLGAVE
jgi:peptidoglycan/LPS O-acetylase OafA/YrhL